MGSLNCFLRPPNKIEEKEENRSIEEMGETRVEQYRERGRDGGGKGREYVTSTPEVPSNFPAVVAPMH